MSAWLRKRIVRRLEPPYDTQYLGPWRKSADVATRDLYWMVTEFRPDPVSCGILRRYGWNQWQAYVWVEDES
jgi:hypothetical protein